MKTFPVLERVELYSEDAQVSTHLSLLSNLLSIPTNISNYLSIDIYLGRLVYFHSFPQYSTAQSNLVLTHNGENSNAGSSPRTYRDLKAALATHTDIASKFLTHSSTTSSTTPNSLTGLPSSMMLNSGSSSMLTGSMNSRSLGQSHQNHSMISSAMGGNNNVSSATSSYNYFSLSNYFYSPQQEQFNQSFGRSSMRSNNNEPTISTTVYIRDYGYLIPVDYNLACDYV